MGMTINLRRQVASVDMAPAEIQAKFAEMEEAMHPCNDAFHLGKIAVLKNCFDPAIVLYTPTGEFRGRQQVMDYLEQRYLRFAPHVRFEMTPRNTRCTSLGPTQAMSASPGACLIIMIIFGSFLPSLWLVGATKV